MDQEAAWGGPVDGTADEEPEPEDAGREGQQGESHELQDGALLSHDHGVAHDVVQGALIGPEGNHEVSDAEDEERDSAGEVARQSA